MSDKANSAIRNLREFQQQLDMDGIMVGVSRQALEETLDYVTSLERQLAKNERALNAYMARDGECPAWLRPAVTDEQIYAIWDKWDQNNPGQLSDRDIFAMGYRAALEAGEDD